MTLAEIEDPGKIELVHVGDAYSVRITGLRGNASIRRAEGSEDAEGIAVLEVLLAEDGGPADEACSVWLPVPHRELIGGAWKAPAPWAVELRHAKGTTRLEGDAPASGRSHRLARRLSAATYVPCDLHGLSPKTVFSASNDGTTFSLFADGVHGNFHAHFATGTTSTSPSGSRAHYHYRHDETSAPGGRTARTGITHPFPQPYELVIRHGDKVTSITMSQPQGIKLP